MSSQDSQLSLEERVKRVQAEISSPEERVKRVQAEISAKLVANRKAQLARLRQQCEQAAKRSYGTPSTTGLLAYPDGKNPQQQGDMSLEGNTINELLPEEQEKRRQLVRAIHLDSTSPGQLQQATMLRLAAQRELQISTMRYQDMGYGLPDKSPSDVKLRVGLEADVPNFVNFRSACREGDLSTVKSIVSSQSLSPIYLYKGLDEAFKHGKVDVSRFLLQSGAPMTRATPAAVLKAPADKQVAFFQLLMEHGWTVNTPVTLLPKIFQSNNEPLFDWFLEQGADPHLPGPGYYREQTLVLAATKGTAQAVQRLLNAGAKMTSKGLHWAAGAHYEGTIPELVRVEPSVEFDKSRIPVMELLLENGCDINGRLETHSLEELYPIGIAVKVGAVERVKWLLSKGADPDLEGPWGSARDCAKRDSRDEMKRVLGVEQ